MCVVRLIPWQSFKVLCSELSGLFAAGGIHNMLIWFECS